MKIKDVEKENILKDYPKKVYLRNGKQIILRPMVKNDKEKLVNFFLHVPEEDRMFLKDDVTDKSIIKGWINNIDYKRIIPIVAEIDNERIIGDASLHLRTFGWMRHIGEIRIVIDREFQRQHLGFLLAREIFHLAMKMKLEKVKAEMMEDQHGAIKIFQTLGFKKEVVLKDHVIDLNDKKHNLVIMTQSVVSLWETMNDVIQESLRDLSGS